VLVTGVGGFCGRIVIVPREIDARDAQRLEATKSDHASWTCEDAVCEKYLHLVWKSGDSFTSDEISVE